MYAPVRYRDIMLYVWLSNMRTITEWLITKVKKYI